MEFRLVLLLWMCALVRSSIIEYDSESIPTNYYESYYNGMYSKNDAPWGHQTPYIDINLNVTLKRDTSSTASTNPFSTLDVILFHSDVMPHIGKTIDGEYYLCCYQKQYDDKECEQVGWIIYDSIVWEYEKEGKFFSWDVEKRFFTTNTTKIGVHGRFIVNATGIWRFYAANCGDTENSKDTSKFYLTGTNVFYNPYGQLPGDIVCLELVYFLLMCLYILFGLLWGYLSWKYQKDLMMLQNWVAIIILVGFIDNLIYGSDYANYNHTGRISLGFNVSEALLDTIQRTVSFVGLMLVSSGYTVVKFELEKKQKRTIFITGALYFVISGIYNFIYTFRYTPQTQYLHIPSWPEYVFLFFTSILDLAIVVIVFLYIYRSVMVLKEQKQPVKLKMFTRLAYLLISFYIVSFIFFLIYVGADWAADYDSWWKGWFIFTGYWPMLSFVSLVCIGWLWRPSKNNTRYAFSAQLPDDTSGGGGGGIDLPRVESSQKQDHKDDDNNGNSNNNKRGEVVSPTHFTKLSDDGEDDTESQQ